MPKEGPHYLLFSESVLPSDRTAWDNSNGEVAMPGGRWRFALESVGGGRRLKAEDAEPEIASTRLELLAVVRGLEALDGPARVTLITSSRYVSRGIRRGLPEWRRHDWTWERFGRRVPIRDHDLWRRVDRALKFHRVECRVWQTHRDRAPAGGKRDNMSGRRTSERVQPADCPPWRRRRSPSASGGRWHRLRQQWAAIARRLERWFAPIGLPSAGR